jgi:hypothetical protein
MLSILLLPVVAVAGMSQAVAVVREDFVHQPATLCPAV